MNNRFAKSEVGQSPPPQLHCARSPTRNAAKATNRNDQGQFWKKIGRNADKANEGGKVSVVYHNSVKSVDGFPLEKRSFVLGEPERQKRKEILRVIAKSK